MKTKYIYFFGGDLSSSHIGNYKSWLDVVENDIDMSMVTVIDYQSYTKQENLIKRYRSDRLKIFIVPKYLKRIFTILYFFYLCVINKKIVVHLRKQSPKLFDILKKIFKNKLKYIIQIEGDFESEIDYLSQQKNQYKPNFYINIINEMKKAAQSLEKQILKADAIFVVTNELKEIFVKRYSKNKIHMIPTGFNTKKFYQDDTLREKYRKKYGLQNRFVMIYSGNVFYSWQNLKRSMEVFKLLKEKKYSNIFFLMLIRKQDFNIVKYFIKQVGLQSTEYMLTNVFHDEVNGFLNASDLGILLRENHTLNKVSSPGKLGEYLSSGLNVLTTKHIGDYSKKMEENNIGILLNDIYNDSEILKQVINFENNISKKEISNFASDNFSAQAYKNRYINILQSL